MKTLVIAAALMAATPAFAQTPANTPPPIRVILVGDSTMTNMSGYGGELCKDFTAQVACVNAARGGRSSKSYRVEGLWDKIMAQLADKKGFSKTYVLIQFGHNDGSPKPERHTNIETEFPVNMRNYARDVEKAGAIPVLITPITQRHFLNGRLEPDLMPWANATRTVARDEHVTLIDLNAESMKAVQAMGLTEANTLAGQPIPQNVLDTENTGTSVPAVFTDASQGQGHTQAFDYTHLGPKGQPYFARMVADLWIKADPAIAAYVKPEAR
ncbi:MAG TPA: rhamnogalacturonan acetylesterase [Asticcacaulis sp.]